MKVTSQQEVGQLDNSTKECSQDLNVTIIRHPGDDQITPSNSYVQLVMDDGGGNNLDGGTTLIAPYSEKEENFTITMASIRSVDSDSTDFQVSVSYENEGNTNDTDYDQVAFSALA